MTEKIGSYDAKTRLPEILRRVEAVEQFTITKRGRPVADIIPRQPTKTDYADAIGAILKHKKAAVSDEQLRSMISTGRR